MSEYEVWAAAADDVHREARWQEEQQRRAAGASEQRTHWYAVSRLVELERTFRQRAKEAP